MSSALRDADWLTPARVRAYAVIVMLASLGVVVAAFFQATGTVGSDFLAFWGAGKAVLSGDPAAAYDLAVQERIQTSTGSEGWFAFVNPPPYLFAITPFALLPYPAAWAAWVALTYALFAWAGIQAFPRLWLLVLAYPGALIAATHAQNGLLTGALLIGAVVALARRRDWAGGVTIGALVIKPHLALIVPVWLAAGGRWRAFVGAGLAALGFVLLSWLAFGSTTLEGYTQSWQASAVLMEARNPDLFLRMSTLYAQLRLWLNSDLSLAIALALATLMALVAALGWRRSGGDTMASGALALAATGLAVPYLFNYDLPFLLLPTLWLVRRGLDDGFRPYEKLLLVGLYFAPYATRAAAFPLGINLMPVAALLLVWMVWTRTSRSA